jgi:hypothetical protein
VSSWESEHNNDLKLSDLEEFIYRSIIKIRNWKLKMKTIGFLLILLGAILIWFTPLSPGIGLAVIIIGAVIMIAGFLLKSKSS